MKQWTREQIMKGLQKMVPEIDFMKKSEDFDAKKGGIWTSGEDACIYVDHKDKESFSQRSGCDHFYGMDWFVGPSIVFERSIDNPGERILV